MPFIKQISVSNWITGIARPVAWLRYTPRELCLSHGIQFEYHEGGAGLGDAEIALLETHSGRHVGLLRYPMANRGDYTAFLVDEKSVDATDDVNELMCDLGFRSQDMHLFDLDYFRLTPCRLLRIDDNGNQFLVGNFECYPDAFHQLRLLEGRGHKQTFLIEKEIDGPTVRIDDERKGPGQ